MDDARLHVVDPEGLVAVITQLRDRLLGQPLGLLTRHLAGHFLGPGPGDEPVVDLDMLAGRTDARLQGLFGLRLDLPARQTDQRHDEGERNDGCLGAERQLSEPARARYPEAMVGEEKVECGTGIYRYI
ncbi:MAG: hypothetical protein H7306_21760 [Bacteriovorax sp.]|nr:hypothetical protein [Rhizobacter sp.]